MATGYIYSRGLNLEKNGWTAIGSSALPDQAERCIQIAATETHLYAAWLNADFSSLGLYVSEDLGGWTAVDSATYASAEGLGREVTSLFSLNGVIFVGIKETTLSGGAIKYKLSYIRDGAAVPCVELDYLETDPYQISHFRSGAFDGTNYFFVSGSGLYRGSIDYLAGTASFSLLSGEAGMPSGQSLKSVSYSPELERLIISTGSGSFLSGEELVGSTPGLIYARTAGGSWEASAPSVLGSTTTGGYANFTDALVLPNQGGSPVIVCASESSLEYKGGTTQSTKSASARGYGILTPAADKSISGIGVLNTVDSQANITTWSNYETRLVSASIGRLYAFEEADGSMTLFACTAGNGLWSNIRAAGGTWGGWDRE